MPLTASLYRLPANTLVGALNAGYDISYQIQLSEPGSGTVTLPLSSVERTVANGVTTISSTTITSATIGFTALDVGNPITGTGIPAGTTIASVQSATSATMSAAATASGTGVTFDLGYDVQINDLIRYYIDGDLVFGSIVEEIQEHTLDEQGGAEESVVLSGRGVGALMEWMVIVPANGLDADPVEEDRLFSWQSAQYVEGADGQDWDEVVDAGDAFGQIRVPGTQLGYPDGAPNVPGAKWIWGLHPTETVDSTFAPGGRVYARATLTLASETKIIVGFSADNYGQFWFDGQLLFTLEPSGDPVNYLTLHRTTLIASAGDHQLAWTARNVGGPTPGPKDNPGGGYVVIGSVDTDGESFGTIYLTTNTTDWTVLGYPDDAPGMTPGQAQGIAFDEGQARGCLPWMSKGFDDDEDSNGTPWTVVGDITTKTGNDDLAFLQEQSVTYIDWHVTYDAETLELYIKDTYAQVGGAAVALTPAAVADPTTGNLLKLDRTRT